VPILVASYDTHGLRWDYSYSPVTTQGDIYTTFTNYVKHMYPFPYTHTYIVITGIYVISLQMLRYVLLYFKPVYKNSEPAI
jgi:hypothetical protein